MRHTEFSLRRPITITMVFLALALVGVIATRLLPLEYFPDIEFPGIFVQIPYPNSTPEEIERSITRPVEEALATLSGVDLMRSWSRENEAQIWVQFGWDEEMGAVGIDARGKIDAIRDKLPEDLERILVFSGSLSDEPILDLRISSDQDLGDSYDMLDRVLKRRIERLEGVSQVELHGVYPNEIRILLDADRIAAHNVDVNELSELLQKSNFSVSAGLLTDGSQRFSVRPQGEFKALADIENIIVSDAGVRLKDIANVELRSPERDHGRHLDRTYAIGLSVKKTTGANLVDVADRVSAEVKKIGELPQMRGIEIFDLDNQATGIKQSLGDLLNAGLIGAILAIGVLYLFLRQLTPTLIVTLSVPFSLLITLGVMYFAGLSLNILSMMGLMLAVGMLVDNSVVVTESIFRYRQMYPDEPKKAAVFGVKEVWLAVLAGTVTSIAVFLPILFGEKTDIMVFLTHVAITISVALIASLVISQTLIPMLATRLKPPKPGSEGRLMLWLTDKYVAGLDWSLRHRWKTFMGIVFLIAGGFGAMQFVHFDAFPQEASRRLYLPYHIEGNFSLERVEAAVDEVEEVLYSNQERWDIVAVYSYYRANEAISTILLKDKKEATKSAKLIMEEIKQELPQIIIGKPSFQWEQTGGGEGFSMQIMGDSTERLTDLSLDIASVLDNVEGLENVRLDATAGEREVRVVVDRERATQWGMSTEEIAGTIATAMRGDRLREFRGQTSEVDIRVTFRDSDRQSIEDLGSLPLYAPSGERVLLGSVATFRVSRGPQTIQRMDRQTAMAIMANLAEDTSLEDMKPIVEGIMKNYELPPGYSWKFGRGFQRQDETQQAMLINILLGIVLIYLVMAALFESIAYPISSRRGIRVGFLLFGV
ncbi:MAG: efflux RND transporter permease subunit [Pseudomonadota bacterium]